MKIPKKYRLKLIFLARLTALGILFQIFWRINPNIFIFKLLTAKLVAFITNSSVISDPSGVFVVKDGFNLLIVMDCTGWKEIFVFLSLFFSWPKAKSLFRAFLAILAIIAYNTFRLSFLVFFNKSFDYFHPAFQVISIIIILLLWVWSISVKARKTRKRRKK